MILVAFALLLSALLLRHPALSTVLSLLAMVFVVGVLDGHPGATLLAGVTALVAAVVWAIRRPRRDPRERELLERRRGWRFEPYVCSDCGQPWEQHEVWDAHAGVWRFAAPPYGFCPVCHPELVR